MPWGANVPTWAARSIGTRWSNALTAHSHGSAFALNGGVIKSPATRPLDLYHVFIENGIVKVDLGQRSRRSDVNNSQAVFHMKSSGLHSWKLAAIIGTLLIAISFPLAYWQGERKVAEVAAVQTASATYVGSQKCLECHNSAWQKWHNSDHDKAMDIATSETVLGDFDNVSFEHDGYSTLFFKNGEEFYVNTEGPDGSMADFQVKYVFGVDPLQQYLIEFPGGRYQVLGVSWDAEQQRWYDMYPDQDIEAGDWLHWTRQAQNWNSMCAECHSTNPGKGL